MVNQVTTLQRASTKAIVCESINSLKVNIYKWFVIFLLASIGDRRLVQQHEQVFHSFQQPEVIGSILARDLPL